MNKEKARKHLINAMKRRKFCRNEYVTLIKNKNLFGCTFDLEVDKIKNEIKKSNERISRLQRVAM